jgi:predicted nuclease of predicted toxin-antitoxin system
VIQLAIEQKRIVLTEDKDFGQLVFAHGQNTLGVMLLRYPRSARQQIARDIVSFVNQRSEDLVGSWIVVQPGRVRIGRTPAS